MIETHRLTKRRGTRTIVDAAELTVCGGRVTAFLGPNGAGKSSTMRMVAGLDRPTSGTALVNGLPIARWARPATVLGSMIDPPAIHPRWRVQEHLRFLAATHDLPRTRVEAVIDECGLDPFRSRRGRELSLGMRQRLGVAMAVLAEPSTLLLDEPMNGLDPEGMRWLRGMLRAHAARGGAVLLSSHQMKEVQEIADDMVVILEGRIVTHRPLSSFVSSQDHRPTVARSPEAGRLECDLERAGVRVARAGDTLTIWGLSSDRVGTLACRLGIPLFELRNDDAALEEVYLDLVEARRAGSASLHSAGRAARTDSRVRPELVRPALP